MPFIIPPPRSSVDQSATVVRSTVNSAGDGSPAHDVAIPGSDSDGSRESLSPLSSEGDTWEINEADFSDIPDYVGQGRSRWILLDFLDEDLQRSLSRILRNSTIGEPVGHAVDVMVSD